MLKTTKRVPSKSSFIHGRIAETVGDRVMSLDLNCCEVVFIISTTYVVITFTSNKEHYSYALNAYVEQITVTHASTRVIKRLFI